MILILALFSFIDNFYHLKLYFIDYYIRRHILTVNKYNKCDKWIVTTASNSPSSFIIYLERIIKNWKIVVIGNNESVDLKWKNIFKYSTKLFYLSYEEQNCLNFKILKYLKKNSYYRKSIGYLYSIQHGAKEIYEIDENLEFTNISFLDNYFVNTFVSYVARNDSLMTNPYIHFGETSIWPRGFILNDLGKQDKNNLGLINSSNIDLKPLIFQGIINGNPDIDSILYLT